MIRTSSVMETRGFFGHGSETVVRSVSRFVPPRHVVLKNSGERIVQSPELQRVMNVASNSFAVPTGMLSLPFVTVDTTW